MTNKNDDKTNDPTKAAAEAQTAHLSGQAPGQRATAPSSNPGNGNDGEYQVGDLVTLEAEVTAVSGDTLSLSIARAPITSGVARDPKDGGATLQLSRSQVRKR